MDFETHPIIKKMLPQLQFVEACYDGKWRWFEEWSGIGGKDAKGYLMRASQINDATCKVDWGLANLFLPIEESETTQQNRYRYISRLRRSRWKPLFKTTINNYVGLLSRYTLSQQLEKVAELNNIDLQGRSHFSFFQECDRLALRDGWCAVWIDYLDRPYLKIIERKQIIDTEIQDNQLIRINVQEAIFQGHELIKRVKVIEPNIVREYIEDDKGDYQLSGEYPYDLPYIPIVFYPVNTISPFKEELPLLEIAEENRTHYQVGSDYRECLHYKSLPIFVSKGCLEIGGDSNSLPTLEISPYSLVDVPSDGDLYVVETTGDAIGLNRNELVSIEQGIMQKTLNFMGDNISMTATEANFRANQQKATYEVYINQKISAKQEIFDIWFDWDSMTLENEAISMDTSFLESLSPEFIRELKELVILNYLDLETFWQILNSAGWLPKNVNIMDIINRVKSRYQSDLNNDEQR